MIDDSVYLCILLLGNTHIDLSSKSTLKIESILFPEEGNMKKTNLLLAVFALVFLASNAVAEVPQMINYQAVVMDSDGKPLRNQEVTLEFRIYDAAVGGDEKWMESQTDTTDNNGAVDIILGLQTVISHNVFIDPNRWLGIRINADAEIFPRTRLVSDSYAFQALRADTSRYAQNGVPPGVIVMWSGTISSIPSGWALCDGTNGTPDLRDKFIKSIPGTSRNPGSTGGRSTHDHSGTTGEHVLTISEMPSHAHNVVYFTNGGGGGLYPHSGQAWDIYGTAVRATAGAGGNQSHHHPIIPDEGMPPYYELAFIMKL